MNNQSRDALFDLHNKITKLNIISKPFGRIKIIVKKLDQGKSLIIRASGAKTARKTISKSSPVKIKTRRYR